MELPPQDFQNEAEVAQAQNFLQQERYSQQVIELAGMKRTVQQFAEMCPVDFSNAPLDEMNFYVAKFINVGGGEVDHQDAPYFSSLLESRGIETVFRVSEPVKADRQPEENVKANVEITKALDAQVASKKPTAEEIITVATVKQVANESILSKQRIDQMQEVAEAETRDLKEQAKIGNSKIKKFPSFDKSKSVASEHIQNNRRTKITQVVSELLRQSAPMIEMSETQLPPIKPEVVRAETVATSFQATAQSEALRVDATQDLAVKTKPTGGENMTERLTHQSERQPRVPEAEVKQVTSEPTAELSVPSVEMIKPEVSPSNIEPIVPSLIEVISEAVNSINDLAETGKDKEPDISEMLAPLSSFESFDQLLQFVYGVDVLEETRQSSDVDAEYSPVSEGVMSEIEQFMEQFKPELSPEIEGIIDPMTEQEVVPKVPMSEQLLQFANQSEQVMAEQLPTIEKLVDEVTQIAELIVRRMDSVQEGDAEVDVPIELIVKRLSVVCEQLLDELGIPHNEQVVERLVATFLKDAAIELLSTKVVEVKDLQHVGTHEFKLQTWFDDFMTKIQATGSTVDTSLQPARYVGQLALSA